MNVWVLFSETDFYGVYSSAQKAIESVIDPDSEYWNEEALKASQDWVSEDTLYFGPDAYMRVYRCTVDSEQYISM